MPRSIRGLGDGVDLLGDDGYAIAPPSRIHSCPKPHQPGDRCDGRYTWNNTSRRLAPLPAWVPRLVEDRQRIHAPLSMRPRHSHRCVPRREAESRVRDPRRYALAALYGEAERVAVASPGSRNDTLNYAAWRLARHLHTGTLTEAEITTALTNATRGLRPDRRRRPMCSQEHDLLRPAQRTRTSL